jgi:hypothetical protein
LVIRVFAEIFRRRLWWVGYFEAHLGPPAAAAAVIRLAAAGWAELCDVLLTSRRS